MRQAIDPQTEIFQFRQKFFHKYPGLEQHLRREKAVLLALMLLIAAHKLSVLFAAGSGLTLWGLIGAAVGIGTPAVFALAAYSGRWQAGCFFYLLGCYLAYDLVGFAVTILPRLREGSLVLAGSPLWFCFLAVTEAACLLLSFVTAIWLTLPGKNRKWAELARRMNVECGQIAQNASRPE